MTQNQLLEEFKDIGDLNKDLEILDLMTFTFLIGSEDEYISFEMRQQVVDCYFRLKRLLMELEKL